MEHLSKADAARLNGSKSKGPKTAKGKARSSRNALTHGLTGAFSLLPGESRRDFNRFLKSHCDFYSPETDLELEQVRSIAASQWRLQRLSTVETHIFRNCLALLQEQIDRNFSNIGDHGRVAYAFEYSANQTQSLALLPRYEAAASRSHERAFKHLLAMRKLRNEPKPETPASPATTPCFFA